MWADSWKRYYFESLLGEDLAGQKRYADAEPLLLPGYAGMIQRTATILAINTSNLTQTGEWIVQLYRDWGQPEKAAEWQSKLDGSTPATTLDATQFALLLCLGSRVRNSGWKLDGGRQLRPYRFANPHRDRNAMIGGHSRRAEGLCESGVPQIKLQHANRLDVEKHLQLIAGEIRCGKTRPSWRWRVPGRKEGSCESHCRFVCNPDWSRCFHLPAGRRVRTYSPGSWFENRSSRQWDQYRRRVGRSVCGHQAMSRSTPRNGNAAHFYKHPCGYANRSRTEPAGQSS